MKIEDIAKICHETNRAYCETQNDYSQENWENSPQWKRSSAIKGVEFKLANPNASPEAQHESWLEERRATGWKYGPLKDDLAKTHPCFMPYAELPEAQRVKDVLLGNIVEACRPYLTTL